MRASTTSFSGSLRGRKGWPASLVTDEFAELTYAAKLLDIGALRTL